MKNFPLKKFHLGKPLCTVYERIDNRVFMSLILFNFNFMQKFRSQLSYFLYDAWLIIPSLCYRSLVFIRKRNDVLHGNCYILAVIVAT